MIAVIKREMEQIGFDEIRVDGLGNILGRIGSGPRVMAFDGHVDVVYPGDRAQWSFDPFQPKVEDGKIWGRGAVDQKGGVATMIHAGAHHQGTRPQRPVHDLVHRHGHGGGLRRAVLAVHPQRGRPEARTRRHHRTDEPEHLPRPPRADGNPRRGQGPELSRLGARARRQRHLQDRAHRPRNRETQRAPPPRPVPRQGDGHDFRGQVVLAVAVRRGRRREHPPRPPAHLRRDQGKRRGRSAGRGQTRRLSRRQGDRPHLRGGGLHRQSLSDGEILSHLGAGGIVAFSPERRRRLRRGARPAAVRGQMDVQHQRHRHLRHEGNSDLRPRDRATKSTPTPPTRRAQSRT